MAKSDASSKDYLQPTNQDYLSYYLHQNEWKPTRPIGPIGAMTASPGPACVNLPTTIGEESHDITRPKAPGYKIGMRIFKDDVKIGPGPGAYDIRNLTNKGLEHFRAPSIGKAERFTYKVIQSPGPAAYNREEGDKIVFPRAPAYSVGNEERGKVKGATGPGPNAYTLPPWNQGPSYSVGKAPRMPDVKYMQNPGPAAYMLPSANINMHKSPAYTIGAKCWPPDPGVLTPGPAAHNHHLVKYDRYSTPRISFGIRHSPYKAIPGFAAEP